MNEYRGIICFQVTSRIQHIETAVEAENIQEAIQKARCKFKRWFLPTVKILNINLTPHVDKAEEHMAKSIRWAHKTHWISVENKLPLTCACVLTYVKGSGIWTALYKYKEEELWSFPHYTVDAFDFKNAEVTHWMPIPQPIMKEKNEIRYLSAG